MVTVEQSDIRGLDIDKTVKGFALSSYVFKNDCLVSSMSSDSVRWYKETAADLEATSPSAVSNVSPLSTPMTLEVNWTRQTSFYKKYFVEGFLSMEDIKGADVDVLARTLLRLTRAVAKQVDSDIYAAIIADGDINTFATTADGGEQWDADSGQDIIKDLLSAKRRIAENNYNPEGASLWLSPQDYENVVSWLISAKGASIPQFSSDKVNSGQVMTLLGLNVKVSVNVPDDEALVIVPQQACTWKSFMPITARTTEEPGIGTRIRVWEAGVAIPTDPKAVCRITDTQT
jgi:hypothetical protein